MNRPLNASSRWLAVVLLLITAATHLPLISMHMDEAPYVGVLFIALTVASIGLAILLVRWDTPAVWAATGLITSLAVAAFLASRTVGLPLIGDDVGNWTEPLGFPAVASETLAALTAALALRHRVSRQLPTRHHPGKALS
jgi:hypothetical protein